MYVEIAKPNRRYGRRENSPSRYLDNSDSTKRRSGSTAHDADKSPLQVIIIRRSKGPKVKESFSGE